MEYSAAEQATMAASSIFQAMVDAELKGTRNTLNHLLSSTRAIPQLRKMKSMTQGNF
jgi:hypothetical protein